MSGRIEFYAPCTLGVESVLVQELERLGAAWVQEMRGGARFGGDKEFGYRANLWLRTAIRVQEKLFQGRVRNEEDLYRLVQRLDWSEYLTVDHTLAVDASVRDSGITHSKYAALKTKDAIVDQFRDRFGKRPNVDTTAPDLPLKVTILRNVATIYRNLSGDSLHKRGWRPIQVKSPLNESTAAGLLGLTGWDGESPIVDPMCGSGTFLIEAACIMSRRAPGRLRMFAFETWPDFESDLWEQLRDQAEAGIDREFRVSIEGVDRHPGAVELANQAAAAAGVEDLVRINRGDARDFRPAVAPQFVVVNPPYGERVGVGADLLDSWTQLGNFLHGQCRGAVAHVLSGNRDLPKLLGLKSSRRMPVQNGPIDCRWLRYEIGADRRPRRGEKTTS